MSPTAAPERVDLAELARQRLEVLDPDADRTALDNIIERLFDRDHRELLTVSAFGSSL